MIMLKNSYFLHKINTFFIIMQQTYWLIYIDIFTYYAMYMHVYVCVCVCVCTHMCMCVCVPQNPLPTLVVNNCLIYLIKSTKSIIHCKYLHIRINMKFKLVISFFFWLCILVMLIMVEKQCIYFWDTIDAHRHISILIYFKYTFCILVFYFDFFQSFHN